MIYFKSNELSHSKQYPSFYKLVGNGNESLFSSIDEGIEN